MVRLELEREASPSDNSSTPSQVAVHHLPSPPTSAMGTATQVAGGTEAVTASRAAGAAARSVSTSPGMVGRELIARGLGGD